MIKDSLEHLIKIVTDDPSSKDLLAARKEYQSQDSYYRFYTVTYLDSIIQNFKKVQDRIGIYT